VKISKLSLCINKIFKYIEDAHSQKEKEKNRKKNPRAVINHSQQQHSNQQKDRHVHYKRGLQKRK
jgi:hypothetical protein